MTMLKTLLSRLGLNRSANPMSDQIKTVDAATVMGWLKDGSAVIVDVREPHEHRAGHIPGATLVPLSRFDPARVPDATGKHLVFHCQSGRRCGPASARMAAAGFAGDIHRLSGGMAAWMAASGPVER
ncbi:rhodanese-like domain-containing protein [Azospirillum formosense]|uniref:Rhodanese-like domain-containing protein n=2 Tax=Azospirillum formosense TaxID=861533 RepID=A0ABX2L590_9PROT|nr:rhodanese-like domain-containing protein [Azospirillum formosense]NUB22998.1 rhodanese-like domain-containing protein [Azospirillum formosense]